MKRRLAMILIGTLCVAMLGACGRTSTGDVPVQDVISSGVEEEPIVTVPVPDMEDTILSKRVAWENNENLYEIPLETLKGVELSEVHRFGNDILLTYSAYDDETHQNMFVVELISLETGEVLCQLQLGNLLYVNVQVLKNHIAVNDVGDGRCYLLDEDLSLVNTYNLPGGTFCLNTDADTAYQFTYDQGVKKIDLATSESTVLFDNMANSYMCDTKGTEAAFVYTDTDTLLRESGMLDLENGQVRKIESPYAYSHLENGRDVWLGRVDTDEPLYVVSDGATQRAFSANYSADIGLNYASGHIIVAEMIEDGLLTLEAYDHKGQLLSRCSTNRMAFANYVDYVWYEEYNGYLFSLMDEKGQDHLMFWQLVDVGLEDSLTLEDVEMLTGVPVGTAVNQELYDRAKQLSATYGVEILIADQCDTEFTDHRAELLLSEAEISQALNTLEYVMGRYPDGFFEQLKHNTYKEIEIQILGVLEKDYSTEEATYISGGFVNYVYPGKLLMALDARVVDLSDEINPIMSETMYHEFSHIIDKRLEFVSQYREDAVYSDFGWEELNPEGFEYNDTYYGDLDPQYADYFVDAYACTNGTEDRARTMEYAMGGYTGMFEAKSGLTDKLEYYCEGIRDSFDTTGWPEVLPWEETLNAVR